MADDIKENEMTSVSSVDYVRALKGKDSVLIKKSDLVELLAGTPPFSNMKKAFNAMIIEIGAKEEYVVDESVCGIFTITNVYRGYATSIYVLGNEIHSIYTNNDGMLSGISLSVDSSRKIHINNNRNEKSVIYMTYQSINYN